MSQKSSSALPAYAATLALVEVGLGSLLHALKVPLAGHFLSLNQGFLLCAADMRANHETPDRFLTTKISNVAALLKSLSPMGKRLTPMLALSAQGFFFNLGNFFAGPFVGITLLCAWAFIQPVLIYYLLYGAALERMIEYYMKELGPFVTITWERLAWAVGTLLLLKTLIGWTLVVLAKRIPDDKLTAYTNKLTALAQQRLSHPASEQTTAQQTPERLALRDLMQPAFLFSLGLMFLFFYFSGADRAQMIWGLMRPIALGWLMFYVIRVLPLERWLASEARPGSFKLAVQTALLAIKKS